MAQPRSPAEVSRVTGLDGVRGLAILWVLAYHLYALLPKAAWAASIPGVQWLANLGWIGVCLFFTLSGYLIIPMVAHGRNSPGFFARFWIRRAFRLLPLYVVLLVAFVVARSVWPALAPGRERLLEDGIPLWSYWALVQNFLMSARNYLGNEWLRVTWSLAVEVQFYALICLVLVAVPVARARRWLVALAVAVVGLRYAVVFLNPGATTPLVVLLPNRLDAFLAGGIVALWPSADSAAATRRRPMLALAALVLAGAAFCWFIAGGFGEKTRWVLPTYYLMLAIGSAAFVELCAGSSPLVKWAMESAPMIRAGQLSYFFYLFHLPVMWTIYAGVFRLEPTLATGAGVAIMAGVGLTLYVLGELSYRFLEAPLIRRSHGYFRSREQRDDRARLAATNGAVRD